MKKTHILLVAALCMVSAALGALAVRLDSTSQAGSGQIPPPNDFDVVNHSYDPPALPSIQDIQVLVGATPDGKLGPETQRLWDAAYNEQCAKQIPEILRVK